MNLFGNEPQERAMARLIHDSNSSMGLINHWTNSISKRLRELDINDTHLITALSYIKSTVKSIEKTQDNYYIKFKNDFKDEQKS